MIKKLTVLLFCLAITTGVACAQKSTTKAKQNTVGHNVAAKVSNATFENSLKVTLHFSYKTYDNDYGSVVVDERETTCSAVIINPQGVLAIKKDCMDHILAFNNRNSNLQLAVDMSNLGRHSADRFGLWCEIEKINRKLLTDKGEFTTFPLGNDLLLPAQRRLETLFKEKGIKNLSKDTIIRILSNMKKAKTTVWEVY